MTPNPDSVAVLREMIAEMANFADVADRCDVTNASPAIRCWADRLAEVLAALSAQGEDSGRKLLGTMLELGCSATAQMHVCTLLGYPENVHPRDVREAVAYFTLHPAPPGSDAVTEEMAADVLHRFSATAPSGDHWPPERCRELRIKAMQQAITNAALAAVAPAGMDRPQDVGEGIDYRVVSLGDAYEPQMRYTSGQGVWTWFPLMADGYWLEPEAFSYGDVTKRSPMSEEDAERAILRARAINGHHIAPANAAPTPPATAGQE